MYTLSTLKVLLNYLNPEKNTVIGGVIWRGSWSIFSSESDLPESTIS